MFFLAFVCVLAGCQKDAVQTNSNEFVSSDKLIDTPYGYFPSEVNDMIANGGDGHFGCAISNHTESKSKGGTLGKYAYPLTPDMNPLILLRSSLPCQPNIPYFLFNFVKEDINVSGRYSATFFLVLNPTFNSKVRVVDIDWELNGQNDPAPVKSFTINNLQMGESNSVTCKVFSTDNKSSVYSQEMTFDFKVLLDINAGTSIRYGSGYSYACTNLGLTQIIAP